MQTSFHLKIFELYLVTSDLQHCNHYSMSQKEIKYTKIAAIIEKRVYVL